MIDEQAEDIIKELPYLLPLWEEAVRTAKPVLKDTYTTRGGIPNQPKLKRVLAEERTTHNAMTRALWVTSGCKYTPHFWWSATIDEAKAK